jgi:hypothetical protein
MASIQLTLSRVGKRYCSTLIKAQQSTAATLQLQEMLLRSAYGMNTAHYTLHKHGKYVPFS